MPRSLRIEFPGAYYHVMARGNRGEFEERMEAVTLGILLELVGHGVVQAIETPAHVAGFDRHEDFQAAGKT